LSAHPDLGYHGHTPAITVLRGEAKRLAAVCGSQPRVSDTLRKPFDFSVWAPVKKLAGEFSFGQPA
jgi:hypothetical protein